VFVLAGSEFGHPLGHLFEPLQLAHGLPEPVELLYGLYIVAAVDVCVVGGGLQHVALHSPQQGLLPIA
jgi:hypothetical protein